MGFDRTRLRRGEAMVGVGGLVLLASTFLLSWYGFTAGAGPSGARILVSTSLNGWHALTTTRWLILATVGASGLLVYLQGTRPTPALPVTMSLIVTLLGGLCALALIDRVVIDVPGNATQQLGAWLALISALAIAVGGYGSLRAEGISSRDEQTDVPTVSVQRAGS
jgi:hypothetical protein